MLELGQTQDAAPNAADLIKDGTEASFMADVIDGSADVPVIVDFWATWCGPCKTLGPMLEAAVTAAKGKVRMVKIDVDREQRLAAALAQQGLPLQSIPTVVAFYQGRPVDMFQGAVPQGQIKEFIARLTALVGDDGLAEAIEAAEQMLAEGAIDDAAQTFAAILEEEPENVAATSGLARAHLALGQIDQAENILNLAPMPSRNHPSLKPCAPRSRWPGKPPMPAPWPICRRPSRQTRPTIKHALTMPRRCMRPVRCKRRSMSCSSCSAGIASGTMLRPRPSFSPFSMRSSHKIPLL